MREGVFTSPLGVSADSTPENAKMTMPAVLSTAEISGTWSMRRFAGSMKNTPITTNATSGISFAIVTASIIRAPLRTPRTLISTSNATTLMIATARPTPARRRSASSPSPRRSSTPRHRRRARSRAAARPR